MLGDFIVGFGGLACSAWRLVALCRWPPHPKTALLLFLITTVTPSVEGSIFRLNPETPHHEYAQSGQKEVDNLELETANAPSTEQAILIIGAIILTICWHLTHTRVDAPPLELSSNTHSLSEDEDLEHNYAPRPAIPHRDTFQRYEAFLLGLRGRERSPLSDDEDLSDGCNTSDSGDTDDEVMYKDITYSCSVSWRARNPDRHTGPAGIQKRSRCRSNTSKSYRRNRMRKPT
jgi:hypothetical protein